MKVENIERICWPPDAPYSASVGILLAGAPKTFVEKTILQELIRR